jgi:CSLREA domain-containing protein
VWGHYQSLGAQTTLLRLALCDAILVLVLAVPATHAQNFTVNSTADRVDLAPGDGTCATGQTAPDGSGSPECTLRAAVQEANADAGSHQITLPAGTYNLILPTSCNYVEGPGPNTLPAVVTPLCFTGQITLVGAGAAQTIIDAGQTDRAAWVSSTGTVTLQGVTIQNGSAYYSGGCFYNEGTLSLISSTVTNCKGLTGGAVYNLGTLNVVGSNITGNNARGGGGIDNLQTINISNSTLSFNTAPGGGALSNESGVGVISSITESTLSGNQASAGGAILNYSGTIIITNSTISGNQASSLAGGIENESPTPSIIMNNVTIAFNLGGGYLGTLTIGNSIIAGNTIAGVEADCSTDGESGPAYLSLGYNLIQDPTGCLLTGDTGTNITGVSPGLGALTSNGGSTQTIALLPGSPAIDAGNPTAPGSGESACAITDQRGFFRPQDTRCDIGAFEMTRGLFLSAISPAQGGSGGTVTAVVSGSGILSGATIQLQRAGQPSILASPTAQDPGQAAISGNFNLVGAAQGQWDVVVTNPNGASATLPGSFTVAAAQSPQLFVSLVGRSAIRSNGPSPYSILIANRGNTDALGVPVIVGVPTGFSFNLLFPVEPPPFNSSQIYTNWAGVPALVTTPQPTFIGLPLFVPVVPAGYSGMLTFTLAVSPELMETLGNDFIFYMYLANGDPYFNPALDPSVVSQFVTNAQSYSQSNWGITIPDSSIASLQNYISSELQAAVTDGRNDLIASLGAQTDAFSLTQFLIDLASVGAAESLGAGAPVPAIRRAGNRMAKSAVGKITTKAGAPRSETQGGICLPGTSCGPEAPEPLPPGGNSPPPPGCNPAKFQFAGCGSITPAQCQDLPGYHVSQDGSTCLPNGGAPCPFSVGSFGCRPFHIVSSWDPNDKAGPTGVGSAQYLSGSPQPMPYIISFENQASATAPAQQVVVTDQLDVANLDLSTFTLGPISFGSYQIVPPSGQSQFNSGIDLRPAQDVEVKVSANLNPTTGLVTWTFTSIDPETGQLTTNPLAGFLPPDVNPPQGIGTLLFSVQTKAGIATNTTTCNQATVVFDTNPALNTPSWCNSFDSTPPVSQVAPLPATETSTNFTVQWSGTDLGAGIGAYTIYVSDNGGPFRAFQTATSATSALFAGQLGHTYGFYSIATDLVGNVEGPKSLAETSTSVTTPTPPPSSLVSITVTPTNASIVPGATQQFTATGLYSDNSLRNVTSLATWSSSSPSIATITSPGAMAGVAGGMATITATIGTISATATLNVSLSSGQVSITASGNAYRRTPSGYLASTTLTFKNISSSTFQGPFQIVFTGLPAGVTLISPSPSGTYNGSPYVTVGSPTSLAPGQSFTSPLTFTVPSTSLTIPVPIIYLGAI